MADDSKVVPLRPRSAEPVPPPPLPTMPASPRLSAPVATATAPADLAPVLPRREMPSVPVALLTPPPPRPGGGPGGPGGDDGQENDEFAPLEAADPDNPTARETLQLCMTLVTALGVAAAKGMWHRARHRQALADEARANADKSKAKAAANGGHHGSNHGGHGGGRGGSRGGGILTGSRHEGSSSRKRGGSHGGGGHGGGLGHTGPGGRKKRKKGPGDSHDDGHGGSHKRRKGPKADRGGRTSTDGGPAGSKRKGKRGKVKGGLGDGPCIQTREPRKPKGDADIKGGKDRKAKAKGGADATTPSAPKPRPVTWKAPHKSKPGSGGDEALPPGRKRWTRTAPATPTPGDKSGKEAKRRRKGGKRRAWRVWMTWESAALKRWRAGRRAADSTVAGDGHRDGRKAWTRRTSWARRRFWDRRRRPGARRSTPSGFAGFQWGSPPPGSDRSTPPPPPRGTEWMRPPPGSDGSTRITVERVDAQPRRQRPQSAPAPVAGAPAAGRPALAPAAAASSASTNTMTTTTEPPASNDNPTVQATAGRATGGGQMNGPAIPAGAVPAPRPSTVAAHGTQYDDDAELTIRDVIEAAEDAAEEITEGVDAARATAIGAERMAGRLESLHAEIVDLKVPGWLEAIWGRLVDKALHVKACAEGLADALPAASEAISVAAANAADRDLGVADTTRDYGHIRPAEREYHDE